MNELFNNMIDGFAHCRMEGRNDFVYLAVNPAFEELTGLTGVVGRLVSEVIPGIQGSNPVLLETYRRVVESGIRERIETYVEELGKWFDIAVYSPAEGEFVAIFHDSTQRKEDAVRIAMLASFPEENPNPVLRIDWTSQLLYANPASKLLLDCLKCEVGGQVTGELMRVVRQALEICGPSELDISCDGRVYLLVVSPQQDYVNVYAQDITFKRRLEDQQRALERTRSETMQVIAHEIRTPLTIISGYTELLLDDGMGPLTNEQTKALEIMRGRVVALTFMANNILGLWQMEDVEIPLRMEEVDLAGLAFASVHDLRRLAELGMVELDFSGPRRGVLIQGDPNLLRQIIDNLVVNALKFTLAGGVVNVSAEVDDPSCESRVRVRDTGIGIPAEKLELIFERFYQVDATDTRRFQGAGIGLSVVKSVTERHGGWVTVKSEPGVGSEFVLHFQCKPIDQEVGEE